MKKHLLLTLLTASLMSVSAPAFSQSFMDRATAAAKSAAVSVSQGYFTATDCLVSEEDRTRMLHNVVDGLAVVSPVIGDNRASIKDGISSAVAYNPDSAVLNYLDCRRAKAGLEDKARALSKR